MFFFNYTMGKGNIADAMIRAQSKENHRGKEKTLHTEAVKI